MGLVATVILRRFLICESGPLPQRALVPCVRCLVPVHRIKCIFQHDLIVFAELLSSDFEEAVKYIDIPTALIVGGSLHGPAH